ncbi:MAG: magnesium-translocating P-type ATPase [Actinomycetota bacterium]
MIGNERHRAMMTTSEIEVWRKLSLAEAARLEVGDVLQRLGSSDAGLDTGEAARRLTLVGPNAVRSHGTHALTIFLRQLRNPLIPLLVIAAIVSYFTGQHADAVIIIVILSLSIGLGFFNEFRSERAVEALHSQIRHCVLTMRGGHGRQVDETELVPGDVVHLDVGDVIPADVRLLQVTSLLCDEAILTGEAMPALKQLDPVTEPGSPVDLPDCAFMGTIVRAGTGRAVVVETGPNTEFGKIALSLGERHAETAFQAGLRDFSKLLVKITAALCVAIFVINTALHRTILDAALFALAIAVGLTPELLPAIVTISLSTGAQRMAKKQVLVRRLVSIEDFGNIELLFTDKTGTLTEGQITYSSALDADGASSQRVLLLGLLCNDAAVEDGTPVGGNPLDQALWLAPDAGAADAAAYRRIGIAPFDYDRRLMSTLVATPDGKRLLITKGAPETLLAACANAPPQAHRLLDDAFAAGSRVVAIGSKDGAGLDTVTPGDEHALTFEGLITFTDPPKADAAASLRRLADLGIGVRIVTGDNERVAQKVCADLGLDVEGTLTGAQLVEMSDGDLAAALPHTTIFARVSPEQKSRVIKAQRSLGTDVGYMGDGVNDAVALHDADVGISVDTASDVAKDAADILLLKKDLGTLADGVIEGRRVFANTIKYILMATSSNFGNMFSAAGASIFLTYLPMLPTQILLNNLLYDASQTTIPTDNVDEEMLARPAHWDTRFIRRYMAFFGPISSVFDFLTFAVMLWVFHAPETLFHTGWFVESLATQTLVIFVIRTRRVPFFKSRPSTPQLIATLTCAGVGAVLPFIPPLAHLLGFTPLPAGFLLILLAMIAAYLILAEIGKARFFRVPRPHEAPLAIPPPERHRRIQRIASRWSSSELPHPAKAH